MLFNILLPDVLQQSVRRIFHHIQHALETIRPAVIGIGHFAFSVAFGEFKEQPQMALRIARTQSAGEYRDSPHPSPAHNRSA